MKFIRLVLMLLAVVFLVTITLTGSRADSSADIQDFRKGEIVVEIKPGASINAINKRNRTSTIERIHGTNFYRLRIPEGESEAKWVKRMSRDQHVLSASLNPVVTSPVTVFGRSIVGFPDDHAKPGVSRTDYISQPELLNLLSLNDAQLRSRGAGVVVALIDTGVDRTHPDLISHLWRDDREPGTGGVDIDHDGFADDAWGWDFVDNDNDPSEQAGDPAVSVAGHGTFIAGLIALVAPESRIMPIRAFAPDGTSNAFTVAAAIKYAVDHGANVINLSFGSPKKSAVVREAIKYARQNDVVLVAAMGNENKDTDTDPQYPAVLSDVIGVTAIDAESRKAIFSNFGSNVRVDALGVKLTSTFPGAEYAMWSGTSFATPLAAAEAALVLSAEHRQDAGSTIEDTAVRIDDLNPGFSGMLGRGRIDPLGALDSLFTEKIPAGNYASIELTPGPGELRARGEAGISITRSQETFEFVAQSLNVGDTYRLFVDDEEIASDELTVSSFGGLKLTVSSRPSVEAGRFQNIKHVELRSVDRAVLAGDFASVSGGTGPRYQLVEKRTPLLPTGVQPQVGGKTHVEVEGDHEDFAIEAARLAPGAVFKILVDGIDLGWAVARSESSQSAFLRVHLTGDGSNGHSLPPSLRSVMNIMHVELRDSSNRVILQGDFLPAGGDLAGRR
ncbi:MAG TPA: S8 family serine peptidase [Blastocatellia bacterium]|nr:S8 family serine peptidase [Blastocatellia bacterium]